jgi:hypothetical protein
MFYIRVMIGLEESKAALPGYSFTAYVEDKMIVVTLFIQVHTNVLIQARKFYSLLENTRKE